MDVQRYVEAKKVNAVVLKKLDKYYAVEFKTGGNEIVPFRNDAQTFTREEIDAQIVSLQTQIDNYNVVLADCDTIDATAF